MLNQNDLVQARQAATNYVAENLFVLCQEYAMFKESGLFGDGKLEELRFLCKFAGPSAQSLATSMIETEAINSIVLVTAALTRIRAGRVSTELSNRLSDTEMASIANEALVAAKLDTSMSVVSKQILAA